MIFKALIILEITVAGLIGAWLFLSDKPAEPIRLTPETPIVIEIPAPAPQETPKTKQVAIPVAIPTDISIPTPKPEITAILEPIPELQTFPPQVIYVPTYITQPAPESIPLPTQIESKKFMASIKIINPIAGKGLGRTYIAQPQIIDETNYVELGLIVLDDAGKPVKNAVVTIIATDGTQNKTLNGTGDVIPQYENEARIITPFYPFHYEFKTVGDHTITFSVNGMTDSVTLTVVAPDPA